jgi:NAD(P)-dependent dehydrogenase (short-subunit alcohol dehydrogenase family)
MLVLNAGLMFSNENKWDRTISGFERHMGVNHLGHLFALFYMLFPH